MRPPCRLEQLLRRKTLSSSSQMSARSSPRHRVPAPPLSLRARVDIVKSF